MNLGKFLTYWSLTFAILFIWAFSIAVALADVKDDLLAKIRKRVGRARLRPINPLAGRSVGETLAPTALNENERWVFHLVSAMAIALRLPVGILVLQDSMGHCLVHFTQGKRLVTYRVDKTWVADAMAGKADQRERINSGVERCLRQEFLGSTDRDERRPSPMTDHEKESLQTVRQFATQIITIATGFIAVVGALLAKTGKTLQATDKLSLTLWALAVSILAGLGVYGAVVNQLSHKRFNAWEAPLRWAAFIQLILLVIASFSFLSFVLRNL